MVAAMDTYIKDVAALEKIWHGRKLQRLSIVLPDGSIDPNFVAQHLAAQQAEIASRMVQFTALMKVLPQVASGPGPHFAGR